MFNNVLDGHVTKLRRDVFCSFVQSHTKRQIVIFCYYCIKKNNSRWTARTVARSCCERRHVHVANVGKGTRRRKSIRMLSRRWRSRDDGRWSRPKVDWRRRVTTRGERGGRRAGLAGRRLLTPRTRPVPFSFSRRGAECRVVPPPPRKRSRRRRRWSMLLGFRGPTCVVRACACARHA